MRGGAHGGGDAGVDGGIDGGSNTFGSEVYFKASNTKANAEFGLAVTLSADGNTLAIGADGESSNATGVNGDQSDVSAPDAGAVYVFTRIGSAWTQQAYIKASNTEQNQLSAT